MGWSKQLGKDSRGSRPRCVLLVDGDKEEVAARLTQLVGVEDVEVTSSDIWMPFGKPVRNGDGGWDATPADEVELDKATDLLPHTISECLKDWWLAVSENDPRTPNWDIASTCTVKGKKGLLLVEAKAHWNEVKGSSSGKRLRAPASDNTIENHERLGGRSKRRGWSPSAKRGGWNISRDSITSCPTGLRGREAWPLWRPVVLVYLIPHDTDIAMGGNLFHSRTIGSGR